MNDAPLERLERMALVLAAAGTIAALLLPRGGVRVALGVAGGALLAGVSYWAIKRGVGGLGAAMLGGGDAPRSSRGFAAFILRYALLAGMAYVMIARLRLHPLGLLAGASVIPLAAIIEAIRHRS